MLLTFRVKRRRIFCGVVGQEEEDHEAGHLIHGTAVASPLLLVPEPVGRAEGSDRGQTTHCTSGWDPLLLDFPPLPLPMGSVGHRWAAGAPAAAIRHPLLALAGFPP